MQIKAIKKILAAPQEEVRVNRIWQRIEVRRFQQPAKWWSTRTMWAAYGAGIVGIVLLTTVYKVTIDTARPLLLQDHSPLPAILGPHQGGDTILSDGSRIALKKETRLEVLANTDTEVRLSLRQGKVAFDVVPHKKRKWQIDCEGLEITVVGTAFSVSRNSDTVAVTVSRGAVLVKGDAVEGGIQRLNAGKSIVVPYAAPNAPGMSNGSPREATPNAHAKGIVSGTSDTTNGDAPAVDTASADAMSPGTTNESSAIWKSHAKQGNYQKAYTELGAKGVARLSRQAQSAQELFELADVARLG
ncbi:MAG: FecR domain-containing protein, partial [Deltaproteobacteria bacterium]|nr:FecR domain-containing protein [Deltaproteobacteria bacterium]